MTKEQFRDDIIITMGQFVDRETLDILNNILVDRLQKVDFEESKMLATIENNNEYYIKLFNAFKSERLSPKTMRLYNFTLERFCNVVNKPFSEVSSNDIEYFLMKQTCSEVSKNNYRRNLSAFFAWLVKKRVISFNPIVETEPYREIKKPIDHLAPEEYEQLRNGCNDIRDKALVEFMRCTAERVGEITNTRVCDIDFATGRVIVYGEKTKTYRYVMLDKVALGYLAKYVKDRKIDLTSEEPLFVSKRTNQALTNDGIRCILHAIAVRGEINRRVYPHLFRKSCATTIVKRGGTIEDAGLYLGHQSESVTGKHYASIDTAHIFEIFNKRVAMV